MTWLRRGLVALLLVAPIAAVVWVAWPSDGDGGDDVRAEGSGPDGALVEGDSVDDQLGFGEVARYRLVGEGTVVIGVRGLADGTLTIRGENGQELAFNDDTNGLDPELTYDLGDDEVTVEVRDLGGNPGAFTLFVD